MHPQEQRRLAVLRELELLDTPAEPGLDALAACAARLTGSPIALISLIDETRQWYKARHGLDLVETPREHAFCAHTILGDDLLEVPDLSQDPRFCDNPYVAQAPHVRFYAGQPLRIDGQAVGSLCVVDVAPHTLSDDQREMLRQLGTAAVELLQSGRRLRDAARQRARLLDFARAAGDWMWESDAEHRYRWLSDAFEPLTGLPAAALLDRDIADAALLDEHGEPRRDGASLRAVLEARAPFTRVISAEPTARGLMHVSRSAVPVSDAAGRFAGYRGTARDVTTTLAAAAEARRGEATLRQLAAQVPGVIFTFLQHADGRRSYAFVSDGVTPLTGLAPAALQQDASQFFRRVHSEDLPALLAAVDDAGRRLVQTENRYRFHRADGVQRWLESRAAPTRLPDGGTLWHGFTTDITEREATAAALREHEERWQLAAAGAGLGLAELVLAEGRVHLDERACANHGLSYPQERFRLDDWLAQIDPADRADAGAGVQAAMRSGAPFEGRYRIHRPDGTMRWLEFVVRATYLADGSTRGVIGTCRDVHEQQTAAELQRQKLDAERASQAKSALLSRVSHELRTPLNAILGFAQLMALDADEPLAPAQSLRLDSVLHAGRHLLALINDVLDLSRAEHAEFSLLADAVELDAALAGSLALVQPLAGQAGVYLRPPVRRGLWARGDARAVEQVLMNLLSNAVKYSAPGSEVTAELAQDADAVTIAVRDHGIGMSAAQQARLFQPFDRLGVERHRIEGSGLGLVIARQLAEAMGGRIDVQSAVGAGSCFTLRLSAAAAPAPGAAAARSAAAAPAAAPAAPPAAQPREVLYIEDEALNQVLMEEIFRARPPWRLRIAGDGAQGLQALRERLPDLLLIDMDLPDTDGLALIATLRADPRTRPLRCIALSADAMESQIAAARAAGFDDYWTKPIDVMQVLARLDALLA